MSHDHLDEQSDRFLQTLSLFSEYQEDFLEHQTIFHTIRSEGKQDLKLRPESERSAQESESSAQESDQSVEPPISKNLIPAPPKPSQPSRSGASHGADGLVTLFSVDESADGSYDHSMASPDAPTSPPQVTTPPVQNDETMDKVRRLRGALGLYPHSLKLSLSDEPQVLASQTPDFALKSVLGEGGMGAIYEMLQTSLHRSVAMKVAKTREWDLKQLAQHCHEAQVSGYLSHSHIPPVHLLAHDVEGTPLIIMKKIEGVTWLELIADPKHAFWDELEIDSCQLTFHLDILERVAQTLSFAHDRGVIHRDLKPANVMVGQHGDVYLLDWGIAIHLETAQDEERETIFKAQRFSGLHKQIVGSPAYMPPEMAKGDCMSQGPMTDVYFLGANLFFLLTQKPVHRGDTLERLLKNILRGELTPIPDHLTPEMKSLLTASLTTDPVQRISSAKEFKRLLTVARTAQQSRELERRGREALERLKVLIAQNLLVLSQGVQHCVDSKFNNYVEMLEQYELAHRSFWAAYQVYEDNQQAFEGFTETLTVWLRRFLYLGEVQAARSIFQGIPDPSDELREEVEQAWRDYLKVALAQESSGSSDVSEAVSPINATTSGGASNDSRDVRQHKSRSVSLIGGFVCLALIVIGALFSWRQSDPAPVESSAASALTNSRSASRVAPAHTTSDRRDVIKSEPVERDLTKNVQDDTQDDAQDDAQDDLLETTQDQEPSVQPTRSPTRASRLTTTVAQPVVRTNLPREVFSFQLASTRSEASARKHIDTLRAKMSLKLSDPTHVFWIKSVELTSGKTVYRIMLGLFETRSQSKSLRKVVRKIMKKPVLKKVQR